MIQYFELQQSIGFHQFHSVFKSHKISFLFFNIEKLEENILGDFQILWITVVKKCGL